jgi:hypothetical protein
VIVFNLSCPKEHVFETWFRSSQDFDEQNEAAKVSCPVCRSTKITKALMSPNVARGGGTRSPNSGSPDQYISEMQSKVYDMAQKVRSHVEENFDYVGSDFPDEARRLHKDQNNERGIYGEASKDDVKELIDEGVAVAPIPDVPPKVSKKKLN